MPSTLPDWTASAVWIVALIALLNGGCASDPLVKQSSRTIAFGQSERPSFTNAIIPVATSQTIDIDSGSSTREDDKLDSSVSSRPDFEDDQSESTDASERSTEYRTTRERPAFEVFEPQVFGGVAVEQLLESAESCHPTILRAIARIDALKGRFTQAGLPNNPMLGVVGEDINEAGSNGRYGVLFGQQVRRREKMRLDQSIASAEMDTAMAALETARLRLQTDVRQQFAAVLVKQEQVAMSRQLVKVAGRAVEVSRRLFSADEVARASVLQAELELEKARVVVMRLENQLTAARRTLAATIGQEDLPTPTVAGSVDLVGSSDSFESIYDLLLRESPELSQQFADIERACRQVARERAEPLSDVTWQTSVMYDVAEENLIGGFQVSMKIPTLNQNQGAIFEAEREVAEARNTADLKALELRQRLTDAWQQFVDARLQVNAFRERILPKSQETLDLLMRGYEAGESDLLSLLLAQRTWFETSLAYLENVEVMARQDARMKGMLLSGSLDQ